MLGRVRPAEDLEADGDLPDPTAIPRDRIHPSEIADRYQRSRAWLLNGTQRFATHVTRACSSDASIADEIWKPTTSEVELSRQDRLDRPREDDERSNGERDRDNTGHQVPSTVPAICPTARRDSQDHRRRYDRDERADDELARIHGHVLAELGSDQARPWELVAGRLRGRWQKEPGESLGIERLVGGGSPADHIGGSRLVRSWSRRHDHRRATIHPTSARTIAGGTSRGSMNQAGTARISQLGMRTRQESRPR